MLSIDKIKVRLDSGPSLHLEDFHEHWHLDRSLDQTPLDPRLVVKGPLEALTKGRNRKIIYCDSMVRSYCCHPIFPHCKEDEAPEHANARAHEPLPQLSRLTGKRVDQFDPRQKTTSVQTFLSSAHCSIGSGRVPLEC
jgi:hypothetical protein